MEEEFKDIGLLQRSSLHIFSKYVLAILHTSVALMYIIADTNLFLQN
jgi:hypothetical protein